MSASHIDALATYGTLAPGRRNHHVVSDIAGTWVTGTIRGTFVATGWAVDLGYPAIVLDDTHGDLVAVDVLVSSELDRHLARLDDFEGIGYERVPVTVSTSDGPLTAWIYVSSDASDHIATNSH